VVAVPSIGRASLVEAPRVAPEATVTQGLYERHAPKILSYCQHQLGSREEAEDAVQTTFMNAFRALGKGLVPESETAWLFKIAENVCLSRRRSSWRRNRIESPSDFEVIEEIVPGPSRQRDELIGIEDALASMPEQQRRAILLREWQGLSYREISDELELSQSAVETLIFRARRSLAQGLEQPERVKTPRRKPFRRALHVIDLGTFAAAAKTLLAGGVAAKATVAAVAVTAAASAASVTPKLEGHSPTSAAPASVVVPAPQMPAPAGVRIAPDARAFALPALEAAPAPAATRAPAPAPRPSAPVAARPAAPAAAATPARAAAPPVENPPPPAPPAPVEPSVQQPVPVTTPVAQPKQEPALAEPTKPVPDEGKAKRGGGNGKNQEPMPIVAPPPSAIIAPAPVLPDSGTAKDSKEKEKERGREKNRRDVPVAPAAEPAPETIAPVEPAAAPAVAEQPPAEPAAAPMLGSRRKK
jgi:RNA polymerase sigma factor (sigma-70 family)